MKDEKSKERLRLVRLLRQLLKNDGAISDVETAHGRDLVHQAVSLGLAVQQDGRLSASAEAMSYLRRVMVEREEEGFAAQHGEIEQVGLVVEGTRQTGPPQSRRIAARHCRKAEGQGRVGLPAISRRRGGRAAACRFHPRPVAAEDHRLVGAAPVQPC
ncbi:hypothetical protein ASF70_09860 [Rhizobium sp. Leaf321]|nr:hypothetical protein ASF70_09860 [Rhizobium sp. Leaf321]